MFRFIDLFPQGLRLLIRRRSSLFGAAWLRFSLHFCLGGVLLWLAWCASNPAHLEASQSQGSGQRVVGAGVSSILPLDWSDLQSPAAQDRSTPSEAVALRMAERSSEGPISAQDDPARPTRETAVAQRWNHLDRDLRTAISEPKLISWDREVVLHWSGTGEGDARLLAAAHRSALGEDLAPHFVIGNGSRSRDGEIECGSRWREQRRSPLSDRNRNDIHICLIGGADAWSRSPSMAQDEAVAELVAFLEARLGHLEVVEANR